MAQLVTPQDDYQLDSVSPGTVTPSAANEDVLVNGNGGQAVEVEAHGLDNKLPANGSANAITQEPESIDSEASQHAHFSSSPETRTDGQNRKIAILTSGGDSAGMNAAGE